MSQSQFISIEGIEGMGKTTVFNAVKDYLVENGVQHTLTREPGGTPIAEEIREILLSHNSEEMAPITELLLMFASRAQHVAQVIKPALARGDWVICDRFVDASFAYQGGARGAEKTQLQTLADWTIDTMPDLTFLLDGDVTLGLERIDKRSTRDRIEAEKRDFFERARQAYLDRAEDEPERFIVLDASLPKPVIHAKVLDIIKTRLHE